MQRLLLTLLFLSSLPALAQAPTLKPMVLVLPVVLRGDYQPLTAQEFTKDFQEQVQKVGSLADLQIARQAELGGMGYTASEQPPAMDQARRLCSAYNATNACWISMRFRPELNPAAGGQPGTLTVAGAARLWVLRASDGKVTIDEPLSVVRTSLLPEGADPTRLSAQLGEQCSHDLAEQIVAIGSQRAAQVRLQGWGPRKPPAASQAPTASANYKNMADSVESYRTVVERGDMIAAAEAQRGALFNWRKLTNQEQMAIEKQYPGTHQWMDGGAYYNVNGYWH